MVSRRSPRRFAGAMSLRRPGPSTAVAAQARRGPRRAGKVEIAFKSPTPRPNGLQATPEGLWIIDQGPGCRATLVRYEDGAVLRQFDTDTVLPSSITVDGEALWIGSTFSYENVRVDAKTGAVMDRKPTPGCTTYTMAGDPPARRSPLALPVTPPPPMAASAAPATPPLRRGSRTGSQHPLSRAHTGRNGGTAGSGPPQRARDRSTRSIRRRGPCTACCRRRDRVHTASPSRGGISGTTTATCTPSSSTTSTPTASSSGCSSPLSSPLVARAHDQGATRCRDDVGVICRMALRA